MTNYKDWAADQDVEFSAMVNVNGNNIAKVRAYSTEGLAEELRKLDHQAEKELQEQWANETYDVEQDNG